MQQNTSHGRPAGKELTPSELVRKHMEDPNHVITDEELRNVKLEFDTPLEDLIDDNERPEKSEDDE